MSNFEFVIIRIHRKMLKTNISATFLMLKQPDNASFQFFDLDMTFKKEQICCYPSLHADEKKNFKTYILATCFFARLTYSNNILQCSS